MTSTTDVSPPPDDSSITTEQPKASQHRPSRLNQALAWVGIVAGGLFIVAGVFFSGFFLSWSLGVRVMTIRGRDRWLAVPT